MKKSNFVECYLLVMLMLSFTASFICISSATVDDIELQILSVILLLVSGLLANAIRLHQKSNL